MAGDGDYMAALRGSNSEQWQSLRPPAPAAAPRAGNSGAGSEFTGGGSCYRCGNPGHWSRDCPLPPRATGAPPLAADPNVPSKPCPCGAGMCVVRTSNTARNPGRQFFTCPKPQDVKCNFFEWCDAGFSQSSPVPPQQQQVSNEPELRCNTCNQPCVVFTAKTEKNLGRRFYKCRTEGCQFFKWCDEAFAPPSNVYKGPTGYGSNLGAYGSYGNVSSGFGGSGSPRNAEMARNVPTAYHRYENASSGHGGYGNMGGRYGNA